MKKLFTILTTLLLTASVCAQLPEKMSYQAVIRGLDNSLVTNQTIGLKISIVRTYFMGVPSIRYSETQTPTTNANGLISIVIGGGTVVSGSISTIDWTDGSYSLRTEIDPTGGTSYTITGSSQMLSVPYALHAKTTDSLTVVTYEIGDHFGGGIIFYVTPNKQHGLIAETIDQSSACSWYYAQNVISTSANHSTEGKNYTDWRLPTRYELSLLNSQKTIVGGFANSVYVNCFYWSSTLEGFESSIGCWSTNFRVEDLEVPQAMDNEHRIRAIRSF